MRFPSNGRAFLNLTKASLLQRTGNVFEKQLLPGIKGTSSESKQNLLTYHVLPLEETLNKFMITLEPLLTPKELEEQMKITREFGKGKGKDLQNLLKEVGCQEKNWLAERWQKAAYLQYRSPVTVFVSPGMTFPRQNFKDAQDYVAYTSKVIFGLGEFNDMVKADKIPIQKLGENELDNSQFGKVFGTCRIPRRDTDEIVYNPCSDYVVVIYMNNFYKMSIYDEEGQLFSASCLAVQLKNLMQTEMKVGEGYGILTTDSRDNWAEAYEKFCETPSNKDKLATIQGALFTVSLDQCTNLPKSKEDEELISSLIHGGGSRINSANRWMDKTIQLVVNPNGNVGFTYEHSPAEGQPIAMMMDYVVKKMTEDPNFGEGASTNVTPIEKIQFSELNDCVAQWLLIAQKNVNKLAKTLHIKVLKFNGYGKEFIKKQGLSPDSFIQIALQLTFYIMHSEPAAQYESAHLRIFEGGRTETIRSCSNESVAFCRAMQKDSKATSAERADKLRKAVNGHQKYAKLALQGIGIDRHLFGLKMMAMENKLPIPDFFSSPGFVKSSHFRVTTSQVATKYDAFMGYGPSVDDGYACCYNPRDNDIILAISAWRHCAVTDALVFKRTLAHSFDQMKEILESSPDPKAKNKI